MQVLLPIFERIGRRALLQRGFKNRFVETRLGRIHVYEAEGAGDLPTAVILHGLGSNSIAFMPFMLLLKQHVKRVVAMDYPGHGFSESARDTLNPDTLFEAVATVLEEVVPEPAILIGNSLGGGVALYRAVASPEKTLALVLLSPAGARTSDAEWNALRAAFQIKNRREARAFVDRIYVKTPWLVRLIAHEMPGSLRRREVRDILASAGNAYTVEPDELRGLSMPVLFFWGAAERIFTDVQLQYFREHLPAHAVIDRPEGFGHCPHFDHPRQLVTKVVAFARSQLRSS